MKSWALNATSKKPALVPWASQSPSALRSPGMEHTYPYNTHYKIYHLYKVGLASMPYPWNFTWGLACNRCPVNLGCIAILPLHGKAAVCWWSVDTKKVVRTHSILEQSLELVKIQTQWKRWYSWGGSSRQKTHRICQGVIHAQKKIEAKLEETK